MNRTPRLICSVDFNNFELIYSQNKILFAARHYRTNGLEDDIGHGTLVQDILELFRRRGRPRAMLRYESESSLVNEAIGYSRILGARQAHF